MKNTNKDNNFKISRRLFLSCGITAFATGAIGDSLYYRFLNDKKTFSHYDFNADGWYISTQEAKETPCT